jgi:hypothetical protein
MAVLWRIGDHWRERSQQQEETLHENDLMAKTAASQGVVDVSRLPRDRRAEGYLLKCQDSAALSPYLTCDVKRFGRYIMYHMCF